MSFTIKDSKVFTGSITSGTTIAKGNIAIINASPTYTDDSLLSIVKGKIDIPSGETLILELVDITTPATPVIKAMIELNSDGVYGFAFLPATDALYAINIYRVITIPA